MYVYILNNKSFIMILFKPAEKAFLAPDYTPLGLTLAQRLPNPLCWVPLWFKRQFPCPATRPPSQKTKPKQKKTDTHIMFSDSSLCHTF